MPTMDAVLPLLQRDLGRYELLARSLERRFAGLGVLFVVVPDREYPEARDAVPRVSGLRVEVVPESLWVPGLSTLNVRGWYRQQIVKLAAAEFVSGDFFLTLDADVICTRACGYEDLVVDGRARCYVIERAEHQDWYAGAEAVLGLDAPRQGILHNVTPVVWSRLGVLETVQHINHRAEQHRWAKGLRGLRQRWGALRSRGSEAAPWVNYLASSTPWAEYALYFTFLESSGRFERYHFNSAECIYDVGRSVWKGTRSLKDWDALPLFEGSGPPYFAIIQSNTPIPAEEIWDKLEIWLGTRSGESHSD